MTVIERLPAPQGRWAMLEHWKSAFGSSSGSSSESWAYSDLMDAMRGAAANAPLFLEQFFDGCEALRRRGDGHYVPPVSLINELLSRNGVGYRIDGDTLTLLDALPEPIPVDIRSPSLEERAIAMFDGALRTSEACLGRGEARQAVQEILWLLETVSTAFKGIETASGTIEGGYFNEIVRDLRKIGDPTLARVLNWVAAMHGYLSSPTGGGVRHGIDLSEGVQLDLQEARLICNLTRSYIQYLLAKHQQLSQVARSG